MIHLLMAIDLECRWQARRLAVQQWYAPGYADNFENRLLFVRGAI